MKKLFLLLPLLLQTCGVRPLHAQQKQPVSSLQEDCGVTFSFDTASSGPQAAGTTTVGSTGTTAVIDNRQAGCLDWMVTYSTTTTVTVISLAFQTATDVAGVPTTWSNYPGTIISGINPNTAVTTGGAVTETTGVKYPFLRMNLTAITGAGLVQGKLYGWKRRPSYVVVLPGTICPLSAPCVVVGNKANNAVVPGSTNLGVLPGVATAAAPSYAEGFQVAASLDLAGNQRTNMVQVGNTNVVTGGVNGSQGVGGLAAEGGALVGNPVRIGGADVISNQPATTLRTIAVNAFGGAVPASVQVALTDNVTNALQLSRVVDNTGAISSLFNRTVGFEYDGIAFDLLRTASLTNDPVATALTGRNSVGAALMERGSRWTVVSTPAANSAASASIASEASVRHILDTVCFSATSDAAVVAANGTLNIRDGATGAGTIIAQFRIAIPVAAAAGVQIVPPFCTPSLNLVGTTATAMTAEFSAGVTGATQSITMTGFNVN